MTARTACFLEKLRRPSDTSETDRVTRPNGSKFRRASDYDVDYVNRSSASEGSAFQCDLNSDPFSFDMPDFQNREASGKAIGDRPQLDSLTSAIGALNVGQDIASRDDDPGDCNDLLQQLGLAKLIPEYANNPFSSQKYSNTNNIFPRMHPGYRPSIGSSSDESIPTPNSLSDEAIVPPRRHNNVNNSRLIPAYIWAGELPQRNYLHPIFSCKVFVGGVPWDITEEALVEAFCPYGACRVEWPGKEPRSRPPPRGNPKKATGYVYIIFEQDRSVKALLHDCNPLGSAGEWYFRIKAKRNDAVEIRQVQIIPWVVSDSSFVFDAGCRLDIKKTVFVGALHGMITAPVLYNIMEKVYGNVVFVGIDTDKHKYPIGSGRVTFSSHSSYFRAIESAFLEIRTSKFSKRVQIDPFLEDSQCMVCEGASGPLFCRDKGCFRYFCSDCWDKFHMQRPDLRSHRPLIRNAPRGSRREEFEAPVRVIGSRALSSGDEDFHLDESALRSANNGFRDGQSYDSLGRNGGFGMADHRQNGFHGNSHGLGMRGNEYVGNGHPGNSVVYPVRVRSNADGGRPFLNNAGGGSGSSRHNNRSGF